MPRDEGERYEVIYVTADGGQYVTLTGPIGWISPPTIELHQPLVGPSVFYDSAGYGLHRAREIRRQE